MTQPSVRDLPLPVAVLRALEERGLQAVLEPARRRGGEAVAALGDDLQSVDWAVYDRQRRALLEEPRPALAAELAPPRLAAPATRNCPENDAATDCGWQALHAGRVALCTVAGGQASRLGFEGPKGAFPLGPVSGASLFQILAGQVRRLRERSGAWLPWIVQTGPDNHATTEEFLRRRNYFNLGRESVFLACQGTWPALAPDGGLLLAAPDRLFRNPDGHGGFYRAVARDGLLELLQRRGVDTLFYCQVDNPLVRMGDPVFLGHHLLAEAEMSVKVVEKTEPHEKVGLVALSGGRAACIEYSDLPAQLAEQRAADGGLRFRAGNIAVHAFALEFVARMARADLPLHAARKKVKALGAGAEPLERDGVKFETFVFDALPEARRWVVQLCERTEEFAPVKNRSGSDSILTARQALDARSRRWCRDALPGVTAAADGWFEILPGVAWDADDLRRRAAEVELKSASHLLGFAR